MIVRIEHEALGASAEALEPREHRRFDISGNLSFVVHLLCYVPLHLILQVLHGREQVLMPSQGVALPHEPCVKYTGSILRIDEIWVVPKGDIPALLEIDVLQAFLKDIGHRPVE